MGRRDDAWEAARATGELLATCPCCAYPMLMESRTCGWCRQFVAATNEGVVICRAPGHGARRIGFWRHDPEPSFVDGRRI